MADRRYLKKMTRYWAAEEARATVALQDALASEWFDYWHTHLDWKGRGNRHGSDRTAVAAALLRLLERAVACRRCSCIRRIRRVRLGRIRSMA